MTSSGRFAPAALAVLVALVGQSEAQPPSGITPRYSPPGGVSPSYNTSVVGTPSGSVPPYAIGYNPYSAGPGYGAPAPTIAPSTFVPPAPTGYGISSSAYGAPVYGYAGYGAGGYGPGSRVAGALYGQAAVISSTGDYYKSIQDARLGREQARQAAVTTRRMILQEEMDYERMRPTAATLRDREIKTDLNWARRGAYDNTIWSGQTLNVLLQSCLRASSFTRGPTVPLDESVLKHINLKDKSQRGNIALLNEGNGKLRWPTGLQEEVFDEPRDRLTANLEKAAKQLGESGDPPNIKTMRALRADLKTMTEKLDSGVEGLSPSDYVRSKSYLNKVRGAVTALSDPTVMASMDRSWARSVRTVGELVDHMRAKGLEFASAGAQTENAAYSSLYHSLRQYEIGLSTASAS